MFIDPLGARINQKTLHFFFTQFLRLYERQLDHNGIVKPQNGYTVTDREGHGSEIGPYYTNVLDIVAYRGTF